MIVLSPLRQSESVITEIDPEFGLLGRCSRTPIVGTIFCFDFFSCLGGATCSFKLAEMRNPPFGKEIISVDD